MSALPSPESLAGLGVLSRTDDGLAWRKTSAVRILGTVATLLLLTAAASVAVRALTGEVSAPLAGELVGVGILLIGATCVWRFAHRPLVEASATGVRIRNFAGDQTLRWDEIRAIEVGQLGLKLLRTQGAPVVASVFASNYLYVRSPLTLALDDRRPERVAEFLRAWSTTGQRPDEAMLQATAADRSRGRRNLWIILGLVALYGLAELWDQIAART